MVSSAPIRVGFSSTRAATLSSLLALLALACREPDAIELVPIAGCGLDQTFSGLRVRMIGDFAPAQGSELVLGPGEAGSFAGLVAGTTGITAEGVFGVTVTAVGRSYGVDAELAAGRLAGASGPALAMWFAAPDSMCAISGSVAPRTGFAWALDDEGHVVIVGGRDASGLRADAIHYDALADRLHAHAGAPELARVGHGVHAVGEGRFWVVGGVGAEGQPLDGVELRVSDDVLGVEPLAGLDQLALAHHAAAQWGARIVLVGGCSSSDALGECSGPAEAATWQLERDDEGAARLAALPSLARARADAHAIVSADGLAYVAGGHDGAGGFVNDVERLEPAGAAWQTVASFDEVEAIVGFTLLDGELIVVADRDGSLHWRSPGGGGTLEPGFRAPSLAPAIGERRMLLTLPGERVIVDAWLFAPGSAALDPSLEIVDLSSSPDATPTRTAHELALLGDGSVLLGGGTATSAGTLPFLARVRPQLDGPDEQVPDLAAPRSDAFVTNTPGAATVEVGGLRLSGVAGSDDALPPVRAHVRGFRSRAFRLEFELGDAGGSAALLLIGQGSARTLALTLASDAVAVRFHEPGAPARPLACASGGFVTGEPAELIVDELGLRVRVRQGERELADCSLAELAPWSEGADLHVGFGVAGPGDRSFRALRLARL